MIAVAGVSHHTAPLALRERFAVPAERLPEALATLRERYGAAVLLSTCNRTELYLSAEHGEGDGAVAALALSELAGLAAPPEALFALRGREAAQHLLRVAAGLDSMMLGEDQILGQVRGAFIAAVEARTTDHLLSRLFHLAIATGRRVRSETALSRHARSVSTAAVQTLRSHLGDLATATVFVIGAGEAGKLTARSLAASGAGRLLIANRTRARATTLAASLKAQAVPIERLESAIAEADAVVCASAAPDYQITPALLRVARAGATRPLLIVDIAVPRDVDPACTEEPGVTLLDIDTLDAASDQPGASGAIAEAEAIVRQELAGLEAWWETLQVVPTIAALRGHAEAIRKTELARTFARLPDLAPRDRARIEALTAAIVSKLLHTPISKLKQPGAGERYAALVHELFELPAGEE
jgi:glutamyl-tRNA reductase